MRVRQSLNREYQYSLGDYVEPLESAAPVICIVDPSKTNMAFFVGDVNGREIAIFEFSGTGMDTSDYCEEFVQFMKDALKNVTIYSFNIEKAILKKGMEHYTSQMVLTEIRALLISVAKKLTGVHPREINNWAWKANVLPDGYRGQKEKGSLRYLQSIDPRYYEATDDVTDAVCMYMYVLKEYRKKVGICCHCKEEMFRDRNIAILSKKFAPPDAVSFTYNSNFSIEDNATYFANRCDQVGLANVSLGSLDVGDIMSYATFDINPGDDIVVVVSQKK